MPRPMKWLALSIAAILSTGCAATASRPQAQAVPPAARIPLVAYSAAQSAALAGEVERAGAVDIWPVFVADYGRTRRAICAAEGWKQQACLAIRRAGGKD